MPEAWFYSASGRDCMSLKVLPDSNILDYNDAKVAILVQFKCPNVLSLCSDKLHEE